MRAVLSRMAMVLVTAGAAVLGGCENRETQDGQPEVAVSNSYLRCVVEDLCADGTEVLSLSPPGVCPGHFDISPGQVGRLGRCRILLLFDFQQKVEESLSRLRQRGLKSFLVKLPPALCVPQTYAIACRQVCDILSAEYPDRAAGYRRRLAAIEERLEGLAGELRADVAGAGAESARVLVSNHQSQFAEWLGLENVAAFVGSDFETVANIDRCLRLADGRDVRFVIANKQEGTALAEALAERLQARAVVFSNFPDGSVGAGGFDRLVRANVRLLVEAAAR